MHRYNLRKTGLGVYCSGYLTPITWYRFVLTLPTSQFAYSHFAYMFYFAYKCASFRLHADGYNLEGTRLTLIDNTQSLSSTFKDLEG